MAANPYESPNEPPGRPPSRVPLVLTFIGVWLAWAFFGVLMIEQFYDEALNYLPAAAVGWGGASFVLAMLTLSSFYLWRAVKHPPK